MEASLGPDIEARRRRRYGAEAARLARRYGIDAGRVRAILERILRDPRALPLLPFPLVPWMLHDLPAEVALRILETEDLGAIAVRHSFAWRLADEDSPLGKVSKLAAEIDAFVEHLHRNREDLLETGLPRTTLMCNKFLVDRLGNLYYTRLPVGIRQEWDGSEICTYHYTWSGHPEAQRSEHADARIIDGLSSTDAEGLEAGRRSLHELKVQVLQALAAALRHQDAGALWPNCLRLLSEGLTYDDATFYLRLDNVVYNSLAWGDLDKGQGASHRIELRRPGGLSDLLEVIGDYERELTIATSLHQAMTAVSKLAAKVGVADGRDLLRRAYVTTLSKPWRADLDHILDELAASALPLPIFWESFAARVNEAIETEFFNEVTVRVKVKRPLIHKFEPYILRFAEFTAAHLAGTGELPPLYVSGPGPSAVSQPVNTFQKVGQFWRVRFHGNESLLRASKGLRYIACLLKQPGQAIHVLDLVRLVEKPPFCVESAPHSKLSRKELEEIGLPESTLGDTEDILDQKATADIKQTRRELQEKVKDAEVNHDPARAEAAREELERLDKFISSIYGLGGRPRQTSSAPERARVNITKLISKAIDSIGAQDPALERHLRSAIKTGTSCTYEPETPIPWHL
jgi:hypothetical protein